jgi:hypothetical protein
MKWIEHELPQRLKACCSFFCFPFGKSKCRKKHFLMYHINDDICCFIVENFCEHSWLSCFFKNWYVVNKLLSAAEITLLENNIIVYKFVQDLHFFVTGGDDENELILSSVLQGFFDAVTLLLRYLWLYFVIVSEFKIQWIFTHICIPLAGTMLTKVRHLRTWISFFYVSTRLLMEGMYILNSHKLSFPWKFIYSFNNSLFAWRIILETNGPLIAEKVTSHNMDADAPLSEQVI